MNLHFFHTVPSTQHLARSWLKSKDPEDNELRVFWAAHQTEGRGRSEKLWLDSGYRQPADLLPQLLCSFAISNLKITTSTLLPLMTGMALFDSLKQLSKKEELNTHLGLKWPNDLGLYVDYPTTSFRKMAGILCEKFQSSHYIVGIGVNVTEAPNTQKDASFLNQYVPASAKELLQVFFRNFSMALENWQKNSQFESELIKNLKQNGFSNFWKTTGRDSSGRALIPLDIGGGGELICKEISSGNTISLSSGSFTFDR